MTTAHDVIRRFAVTVRLDTTVQELAEVLAADDIGVAVVRGYDGLAGVVSERDIVRAIADGLDPTVDRAEDIMSPELLTCPADIEVSDAGRMMLQGGVRHLVVLTAGDETHPTRTEVISLRDVMASLLGPS